MKYAFLKNSLPFRILILTLLVLVIPLFIFAFVEIRNAFLDKLSDAENYLVYSSSQKAQEISDLTSSKYLLLDEVSYLLDIPKLLPSLPDEQVNQKFREMVEIGNLWGMAIFKINKEQQFINVASQDPFYLGGNYTLPFKFFNAFGKKKVSFLIYDNRPPYEQLFLVSKLIEVDQTPIAAFLIAFPFTKALKRILKPISSSIKLEFALLTQDKIVFASSDPKLLFNYFAPISAERRAAIKTSKIYNDFTLAENPISTEDLPNTNLFQFDFRDAIQMAALLPIRNSDLYLLAYTSKSALIFSVVKNFLILFVVFLVILFLGGGIVIYLTKKMAQPFHQLSHAMDEIKNQNYAYRYQSDPFGFEINHLGSIFNTMIDTLLENMHRAEEERVKREAIAQELRIGHQVQKQLLPQSMPHYPKVEIADMYLPAKEVGGDFYDVFIQNIEGKQKLFLSIADTSGKGISACLFSLGVRSLLRSLAKEKAELSEIIRLTNKNFYEETGSSGMFVTAFVGTYDNVTEELTYFSCGHNPAIVKRKNNEIEILGNHGIAMGVMEITDLEEKKVKLLDGDTLLLYTDGVSEAHNSQNELFGMERMIDFLKEIKEQHPKELIESFIRRIKEFTDPAPQHDDITMLLVKIVKNS